MDIKRALYDGITDQLLCTVVTCNGTDSSLDRLDKCVSNDFSMAFFTKVKYNNYVLQ